MSENSDDSSSKSPREKLAELVAQRKAAAKELVAKGTIPASAVPTTDGFKPEQGGFIDGITYNGKQPNAYLAKFTIGLKTGQTVSPAGVK